MIFTADRDGQRFLFAIQLQLCYNEWKRGLKTMLSNVVEKFLHYISFDTMSDESSQSFPSTTSQVEFAKMLKSELEATGLTEVTLDDNGYIFATIPATKEGCKTLGLIAHMDTAPDFTGANIKPRIVDYQGGDIVLNEEHNIVMHESEFSSLSTKYGHKLIVTDGTTLLGADDKAGLAEITAAADYLLAHPEIPHGKIRIGITPDEEVGQGADRFDVKAFGADIAVTVDGSTAGEVEYENFNAASLIVNVRGINIHPGSAKNHLKNALLIAMEFEGMLPINEKPQFTEKYEGFYHLNDFSGDVENAKMFYIIRDHDREKFEQKKAFAEKTAAYLNEKYGKGTVELEIKDSYYNMKEKILPHMYLIDLLKESASRVGLAPEEVAIRGGTDGARLSFMGLPCPNIGTGGQNGHGRFEYADINEMELVVRQLIELCQLIANL